MHVFGTIPATTDLYIQHSLIGLLRNPWFGGRMDLSPQNTNYSKVSLADRIRRKKRWDDEGVAATVGTIMALLVFLTFMGLFTNQFVPVWMSDNESAHMSTAVEQFINLKSAIDLAISRNPNSLVAPSPIFVPITLSSAGIPIFAGPTAGILTLSPDTVDGKTSFNTTYEWVSTVSGTPRTFTLSGENDGHSGGSLELYCPNRYFVEQYLIYESGAVILNQSDGEFVIAGPQLAARNTGSAAQPSWTIMITQVTIKGVNNTIGGTGSKGVTADLKFADTVQLTNDNLPDLTFTIRSKHGVAWADYFNRTLNSSGMVYGTHYEIVRTYHDLPDDRDNYYVVTVTVHRVSVLDHTRATVSLSIGEMGII